MKRRWLIIVAWFIAGFLGWAVICNVAFFMMMYAVNDRGVKLPGWLDPVYNIGMVAIGTVAVPVLFLVLAIMGRLPGTRPATADRRPGFSVDLRPPGGTA